MRQSGPIADYVDALARELSFDTALSRRARAEAEDHLWLAASDQLGESSPEAQRRVILNFGDPRELARQYAAASLLAQTRQVGAVLVLALACIFVAMKGRLAWYGLMQWEPSQDFKVLIAIGLPIDHYAFILALSTAVFGCGYIATRRAPIRFDSTYGKELSRCIALCGAATCALLLSVAIETVLTGIRLFAMNLSAALAVPAVSLAVEIAVAGMLILRIRATIRRTAVASSVLRN